jgi:hypothetical protein
MNSNPSKYYEFIKAEREIAKAEGTTFSQIFLRNISKKYKKIEKQAPHLWRAIMSKKYLLPQYRQQDYVNQEVYSYLMLSSIIGMGEGDMDMGKKEDEVVTTHYVSCLRQIEFDRPTYWLERELAKPMMKTKLPGDLLISDINWRWPCFRVYLPKGTLTIEKDGQTNNIVYLDILKVTKGEEYTLPSALKKDLWTLGAFLNPSYRNDFDGFSVSGIVNIDDPESTIGYSGIAPLNGMTVQKLMDRKGRDLNKDFPSDSLDDDLVHRMLGLGLNILIGLSNPPQEYDTDPSNAIVRRPKQEGDRTIPGLYHAKFVGDAMLRPKAHVSALHLPSGYTQEAQWRSGHWKRVWFGPKKGQSRLQWIPLYHTGTDEEAGEPPIDKIKPV